MQVVHQRVLVIKWSMEHFQTSYLELVELVLRTIHHQQRVEPVQTCLLLYPDPVHPDPQLLAALQRVMMLALLIRIRFATTFLFIIIYYLLRFISLLL